MIVKFLKVHPKISNFLKKEIKKKEDLDKKNSLAFLKELKKIYPIFKGEINDI